MAFDLKSWVSNAIISAYRNGAYSDIDVAVLTANYVSRGLLTSDDAAAIAQATTAPQILTQPQSASGTTSGPITLSVDATGAAPLAYQWAKDGKAIDGATSAAYTISAAKGTDAGSYTVMVSNSAGSVTSDAATVQIGLPAV